MVDGVKIRGSVMKDPRDWLRTAYGKEAFEAALSQLSPDERAMVDGDIYASTWYPIASWDRFLSAMREQAAQRAGESTEQFNHRFMFETGSGIVRGVYRFVLGLMSPTTVIEKATTIYNRAYSEGHCQVLENTPGRATVRHTGASPELRTNLANHFATGFLFVLGLHGAKDAAAHVVRDDVVDGKLVYDVAITYAASS